MTSLMKEISWFIGAAASRIYHSRSQLKAFNLKCRCAGSGASSGFGTRFSSTCGVRPEDAGPPAADAVDRKREAQGRSADEGEAYRARAIGTQHQDDRDHDGDEPQGAGQPDHDGPFSPVSAESGCAAG